ncbi:LysR substrate-binding domain-containing protein [Telluria mixta]|uniref:LysR substrate-binding domain-containing protein n=1 Tax=Telluria mixta TaxID=34071 RepID=A0ABT2C1C7_9BURK|nr:LysR substrate-binding domain-containing protein [Telluria mixta]MCS0631175.1 LysR substrate-binding domain-containing protein [Telluria mixta]WEM95716.1 LysR substrate-binding domain-containing protein [Telluria mixta]
MLNDIPVTPDADGAAVDNAEYGLPFSLKTLRSAVAVVAHGSTARAAVAINKSATAITRSIQLLETAVGLPLFERHTRGMVPTAAGRIVVARATRAFDQLELGAREVHETAAGAPRQDLRPSRLSRMVNERLLFVLIAVTETGSATQAAERLDLSQPAVSQAIRELEHLADTSLVERTPRGVRLTGAGEILLRRIKLAFMELRVASEELASMQGVLQGRVTIAASPYASADLVPRAITQFLARHPQIKVTLVDGTHASLIYQLRNADIDIIVSALRDSTFDDVEQEILFDDTLSVVCRVGHPYAQAGTLSLPDVVDASWIAPVPNTAMRTSFAAAFQSEGIAPPEARLEVHNPVAVCSILQKSDYLALLCTHQIQPEIAAGRLTVLPIALDATQRRIGLTLRRDGSPSPGVKALREELHLAAKAMERETAASA